jgi:hypothetical protein
MGVAVGGTGVEVGSGEASAGVEVGSGEATGALQPTINDMTNINPKIDRYNLPQLI